MANELPLDIEQKVNNILQKNQVLNNEYYN